MGMNFHAVVTFKVVFKIDLNMLCPVPEKNANNSKQKMVPLFINKLFM